MQPIKYYDKNNNINEIILPSSTATLKEKFPNYRIKMAENSTPLLSYFNKVEINVHDLNALLHQVNLLDENESKKLLGVLKKYEPSTINAIFHAISSSSNFTLVSDYEDFYNTEKLGRLLYEKQHPNPLTRKSLQVDDYIEIGLKAKLESNLYTSPYGWIIETRPYENIQYPIERFSNVRDSNIQLLRAKISNSSTQYFVNTHLPIREETLLQLLGRLEIDNSDDCLLEIDAYRIDKNLYRELEHLFEKLPLDEINQIAEEIQLLDTEQLKVLTSSANLFKPQDSTSLFKIMDNLDLFESLDFNINNPSEYALLKLNKQTKGEFENIRNLMDENLDYTKLGKTLIKRDNIINTRYGPLKVDENFEHFLGKDIELTHDF